ncbi:MAG: hypothetical protein AAGI72_08435 [Pseudomonadota bacterium]
MRFFVVFFVLVSVFTLASIPVRAGTVDSGSSCNAITPAQATRIEWRPQGLTNRDANNDWFVVCPFVRKAGYSEQFFALRAVNISSNELELTCDFREWADETQLQSQRISIPVPASSGGYLTWTMTPEDPVSVINAVCQLPADVRIASLDTGFTGRCNLDELRGLWQTTNASEAAGIEIAGFFFESGGQVDAFLINAEEILEGKGTYTVDSDVCSIEIDYLFDGGSTPIRGNVFGFLSENKQSFNAAFVNDAGFFNSLSFDKLFTTFFDSEGELSISSNRRVSRLREYTRRISGVVKGLAAPSSLP